MQAKLYTGVLPFFFFLLLSFCSNRQRGIEQLKASASQVSSVYLKIQALQERTNTLFLSSDTLLMDARNGKARRRPVKIETINMVDTLNYDTIDNIDQQTILKHEY
jgi:hypothetical protein